MLLSLDQFFQFTRLLNSQIEKLDSIARSASGLERFCKERISDIKSPKGRDVYYRPHIPAFSSDNGVFNGFNELQISKSFAEAGFTIYGSNQLSQTSDDPALRHYSQFLEKVPGALYDTENPMLLAMLMQYWVGVIKDANTCLAEDESTNDEFLKSQELDGTIFQIGGKPSNLSEKWLHLHGEGVQLFKDKYKIQDNQIDTTSFKRLLLYFSQLDIPGLSEVFDESFDQALLSIGWPDSPSLRLSEISKSHSSDKQNEKIRFLAGDPGF